MTSIPQSRAEAQALDQSDPLARCREQFILPEGITYLVGHSLGPAQKHAVERVSQVATEEWAQGLVRSWNTAGWIDLAQKVGGQIAPLIGAKPSEVIICDSVSINLFKLAAAALEHAAQPKLLIEDDEFPTDQYIIEGLSHLASTAFEKIPAGSAFDRLSTGGVLIKSAVNYRTAEIVDIAAYESEAASHGALIVWDLSHATGVVDLTLNEWGARLAAGCTYKYLNGGPGAPAFIYAADDLANRLETPLPGWLGHKAPFAFSKTYEPAAGVARFTAGTPGILSLSALSASLEIYSTLHIADLHRKACMLGDICIARASKIGLTTTSPRDGPKRGGHVSLIEENGYAVSQALAAQGILTDFRTPTTIRFGFSPLYLTYQCIWDAIDALGEIIATRSWDQDAFKVRRKVT